MVLGAYSVFDVKSEIFSAPIFFPANAVAARAFNDMCADVDTYIGKHPADYVLYHCGGFDTEKGTFEPLTPSIVVRGVVSSQMSLKAV